MGADNQQPFPPLLPDQIFGKRVGELGARRRDMDDVGAAVLLAQPFVGRAGVEHQRLLVAGKVSDFQQRVRRQIDDQEADAGVEKALRHGDRIRAGRKLHVFDRERLVEKLSGRVVVGHRQLRPGDEIGGGGDVED